jgi:hypothetical protein
VRQRRSSSGHVLKQSFSFEKADTEAKEKDIIVEQKQAERGVLNLGLLVAILNLMKRAGATK